MEDGQKHPEVALVSTGDGTHTLKLRRADEHYHSTHGALQESQHVFILNGAALFQQEEHLRILEVGFGTGANALLTALWAEQVGMAVQYVGLEKYPLDGEIIRSLNYGQKLGDRAQDTFSALHDSSWDLKQAITAFFELEKRKADVNTLIEEALFHLIYYDAFGPRTQPEMWVPEVFGRMLRALLPGGKLVTYCAKGQVRRDLQAVGFEVERLPGPPGKREMLRATKP